MTIAFATLYPMLTVAALCDLRWRIIPNRLCAALAVCGAAVAVTASGFDAVWTFATALAVLAGAAGLFAAGVMGGGDVKLAAASALWLTPAQAPAFLLLTSLAGGVLALVWLLCVFVATRFSGAPTGAALRASLRVGVPYGVAIAAAAALTHFAGAAS
jgi:prepilin peptidase CpaA